MSSGHFCKTGYRFLAAAAVVLFHGAAVMLSFYLCFLQGDFLKRECFQYGADQELGISKEELGRVVDEMMAWIRKPDGELQTEVTVDGKSVPFFRDRDLQHLADIADKVSRGRMVCALICPLTAAVVCYLVKKGRGRTLCRAYLLSLAAVLLTAGGIGIWLMADPVGFIRAFHRLFFRNGLWILNPATDMLIHLFPESLFQDGGIRLAAELGLFHLLAAALAVGMLVRKKGEKLPHKKSMKHKN